MQRKNRGRWSTDATDNKLGFELTCLLKASKLSARELADRVDLSYEQTRKVLLGSALPSRESLERICHVLHADVDIMTAMLFEEKARRVYGSAAVGKISGSNPEIAPIESRWTQLSDEQKALVIDVVRGMVQRNQIDTFSRNETELERALFPEHEPTHKG